MNPVKTATHATSLIAALRLNLCSALAASLNPSSLAIALQQPRTHKAHPLAHLVSAAGHIGQGVTAQVLANLELALRACVRDPTGVAKAWVDGQLDQCALDANFANAASRLAEVRAFGTLWDAGLSVTSVRTTAMQRTHDFNVTAKGSSFCVEVHCKQMNSQQAAALAAGAASGSGGGQVVYPAGQLKTGETTAENVASKFAQIKPRGGQAAKHAPTILWLDLQDEDWWAASPDHAEPYSVAKQQFFSGGLWHAIYGVVGTPIFEYHSTEPQFSEGVPKMAHPGMFEQTNAWSAVVLSFPRATIAFENPKAHIALRDAEREALVRLGWFDAWHSRLTWPPGVASAEDRVRRDRDDLDALAKVAIYRS